MQRYFAKGKVENTFNLLQEDYYHIETVMRMQKGDKLEVVHEGNLYECIITSLSPTQVTIQKELPIPNEILRKVILVIPLLKEQKMDFILQKATELGVSDIVPFLAKRSIIKLEQSKISKKQERWNRIIKEASEQSMRTTIPCLHPVSTLEEVTKLDGTKVICSTTEKEKNLKMFLHSPINCDTLVIVVGPEGGLDHIEEEYLEQHDFTKVSLGPRIMRVETVPIYILSILNYESME